MANYYRGKCRALATLDMIWSSIGVGTTLLTFFGIAIISQPRNFERHDKLPSELAYQIHADLNDGSPDFENKLDCYNDGLSRVEIEARMYTKLMLGVVLLVLSINSMQLVAAMRLLKACDKNSSADKSLRYSKFWLAVTVISVAFVGLTLISPVRATLPGQILSLMQVAFRVVGYHYVSLFMNEIRASVLPITVEQNFPMAAEENDEAYYPKPANSPPPYADEENPPAYGENEAPPPPYEEKV